MRRALSTLFAIAALVAALLTTTAPAQAFKDLDCGDFPNQAAAQANHRAHGKRSHNEEGRKRADTHRGVAFGLLSLIDRGHRPEP